MEGDKEGGWVHWGRGFSEEGKGDLRRRIGGKSGGVLG
jgi:hypothetical protein